MRIEQLKPSQRVKGRWLAVMEDGSILRLGEGEVIDFVLYEGKELSPEEADGLTQAARKSGLKEKALSLLTVKPQSRRELERKLEQWEANEQETASVCDRMEELGLLNDETYALQVVRHYSAKGYGVHKLRDELYRRGVPRELWQSALEQAQDPTEAIDEFVAKKLAGKQPDRKLLQKVSDALVRRGFGWEDVRDALARYGAHTDD
ncbi:MAG: regulatory protein RecX [Oscillospiraceae bacterium]|nr:regulatory protein RecX [Oscillospiraceae bacterium]